jgi:hypothetical protein
MSEIVLVDTSVLMNVLAVPGFDQRRAAVLAEFTRLIDEAAHLFLPMAALLEAGNHIAQLADGRVRRETASRFAAQIRLALAGQAPWRPMQFLDAVALSAWIDEFPDAAMQGLGIGDLSIRQDWQTLCTRHPLSRVRVWTLDADLAGLDQRPGRGRMKPS